MLKTFLATTAIASLAMVGAYAQEAGTAGQPAVEEPMAPANTPAAEADKTILPEANETAQDPSTPDAAGDEPGTEPMQAQEAPATPPADTMQADEAPATPPAEGLAGDAPPLEEGYTEVDVTTLSADDLIGTAIQTYDDQNVATVNDVILSDEGQVENIVAEFGGFLGFGARTVLLTMDDIQVLKDPNGNLVVRTGMTPEELETRPDYEG